MRAASSLQLFDFVLATSTFAADGVMTRRTSQSGHIVRPGKRQRRQPGNRPARRQLPALLARLAQRCCPDVCDLGIPLGDTTRFRRMKALKNGRTKRTHIESHRQEPCGVHCGGGKAGVTTASIMAPNSLEEQSPHGRHRSG